MYIKRIIKYIKRIPYLVYLKFYEHTFEGRIRYLLFRRNSPVWVVVFSAFDSTNRIRLYNYVKSLSKLNANFIFLSDPYGYRGSYYLLENGYNTPEIQVQRFLSKIIPQKTGAILYAGTSKGGSAALYFGLKNKVDYIIIGACQYLVGHYVANYPDVFRGMTGNEVNSADIEMIDSILYNCIKESAQSKTEIHLIHSKLEPTYEMDEKYLIEDLNRYKYNWTEIEKGFKEHNDVGKYFPQYAKMLIQEIINQIRL